MITARPMRSTRTRASSRRTSTRRWAYPRVSAVRFDGDTGYIVTFKKTDPLFVIDLSDPTDPTSGDDDVS